MKIDETVVNAEDLAKNIQIKKLELQAERMRLLATVVGFYKAYFQQLPESKTNQEAFTRVNDEYFELFGEYRYLDFNSFKSTTTYYNKKSRK